MPDLPDAKSCAECARPAPRLRRDRCDACYMRLYRGGDVPAGATCAGCGERRRELLCVETVGDEDAVVCGNCSLLLRRVRPRLGSLADLRRRRLRDRRGAASPPGREGAEGRRAADRVEPAEAPVATGGGWDASID